MSPGLFRSAVFAVGPLEVFLESNDQSTVSQFEPLFSGFTRVAVTEHAVPLNVSIVDATADPVRYHAVFEGQPVGPPSTRHELELSITRKLNRAVLDAEVHLLHLHAGAVHRAGVTVLVIGSSMAGKSTLVAKLVAHGWQYLSDEQVGVTASGGLVRFPRPITLRQASWPLFDFEFPAVKSASDRIEIPPTMLGAVYSGEPVMPNLIIRPDVSIEHAVVERLSIAEALSVLVEDSLDLERAGQAGVSAMLAITSAAPAYRVTGQDLSQTLAAIEELCGTSEAPGPVVDRDCVEPAESSERVRGSLSWLFADRSSALYEPVSGSLVRLDEAGFQAWHTLRSPAHEWPEQLRNSDYVASLREAGLLEPS